jgi:hypothetical protein
MKQQIRVLGIDDSPFKFKDERALVVGALVRVPNYLEGLMKTEVAVDGTDATAELLGMVTRSRYRDQIKAVMIDGIAVAGFNVIDVEALHASLKIPVITVTRDRPDFGKMEAALRKYFDDWKQRYELISKLELIEIGTEHKPVYACGPGLGRAEIEKLVRMTTIRGSIPEPLRIAHLVSTAMVRGESYGRS